MIKNTQKPAFLCIELFAKSPNKIDATQHYWNTFIQEIKDRFIDSARRCDMALQSEDKDNSLLLAIKQNNMEAVEIIDAMAASIHTDLNSLRAPRKRLGLYSLLFDFIRLFSLVHELNDKDILLKVEPTIQDALVNTDELMLKHVIHHLLANGVKYGDVDTCIEVSCRKHDEHLLIEICYQGAFFPTGKASGTVPPFSGRTNMEDVGLGLYISSLYIETMNGSIGVESRDNFTIYSVSIPMACLPDSGNKGPDGG